MSRILAFTSTGTTYSDDGGYDWPTSTSLGAVSEYCKAHNNAGGVVMVFLTGTTNTTYRHSNDSGITWTTKTLPITGLVRSCVWVSAINKFVFSWDNGSTQTTTWSSSDGVTWASASIAAGYWTLATDGTTVVATDPFNNTARYGNGTSWTAGTGASGSGFYNVWVGGTTYVSLSHSGTSSTRTSNGGLTWTAGGITPATSGVTMVQSNGSGTVIANLFGQSGKITRSTDGGVTWSAAITATGASINGITWFDNKFIISTGSQNFSSTDGLSWSPITSWIVNGRGIMGIVNPNWSIKKSYNSVALRQEKLEVRANRQAVVTSSGFIRRQLTMGWNTVGATFSYCIRQPRIVLKKALSTGLASFIKNIKYSRTFLAVTAPTAWRHRQFQIKKNFKVTSTVIPTVSIGMIQFVTALANSVSVGIAVVIKTFKILKGFPLIAKARQVPFIGIKKKVNAIRIAAPTATASMIRNKRYAITLNTSVGSSAAAGSYGFTPQAFVKLV